MDSIYFPLIVQIGLTISIAPFLVLARMKELRADRSLARKTAANSSAFAESSRKIANNFDSQFQLPVLFYLGCVVALMTGAHSPFVIGFAWVFVAFRIVHTVIHTTTNYVPHRFLAFAASLVGLIGLQISVMTHALSPASALALPA